jgi:hypothetical protein
MHGQAFRYARTTEKLQHVDTEIAEMANGYVAE